MRISIYVFYVSFADILYWSIEKKIDWPKTFDLHYISNINSLIKLKDTLFYWIDIEIGNIQDCSIWGYYKFEGVYNDSVKTSKDLHFQFKQTDSAASLCNC